MIPYIEWQTVEIGGLTLYVWGFFVALGFVLGAYAAGWKAKKSGGQAKIIYDLVVWMMIAGLVGGRLGYVLFYDPVYYLQNPLKVFEVWAGGSSIFGGFILCVIIGALYLRRKKVNIWEYSDFAIFGLPIGLWIGRIGCFLIHDHPGTETNFFLGTQYPDGIIRHDHGLYLSLNGLILTIIFFFLSKKERPPGFYIAFFSVWYGAIRFGLDFLRINDVRYVGLTPAQYLSIAMVAFGIWVFYKIRINSKN
ncbi:MAG: prolipoprotein diacylglyceryl transferase [Patescibacteria group bacterium]